MKTFAITTLGCRVNHYEGEQLATLLRGRGLTQTPVERADLRIVHTCSVTVQAASKSRQTVRRSTRLNVLGSASTSPGDRQQTCGGETNPESAIRAVAGYTLSETSSLPSESSDAAERTTRLNGRPRVIVTGCWATSDRKEAAALPGVDAVLGHLQDVGRELTHLLTQWEAEDRALRQASTSATSLHPEHDARLGATGSPATEPVLNDGWMMQRAGTPAGMITSANEPHARVEVNGKLECDENDCDGSHDVPATRVGMRALPQLADRQNSHQRAFLKVQDGCDAHCTYCIIPQLRPGLWSKPVGEAVAEAIRLTEAGHAEIVLTGIFIGAYGQRTALRRRQTENGHLAELVSSLCTRVPELRRLRLSSIEPGDLTDDLIDVLRAHKQVVPHFHLPLQSGSDKLLRRMNRQYTRGDYLRMVEQLYEAFDRPAITTDIIVGFPGESDEEFEQTLDVVERVGFVHIHGFSYSPRPNTAAARWTKELIRGPVVNRRIDCLRERAADHSLEFRRRFVGEEVEVLVEHASGEESDSKALAGYQHGRCERYFAVHFDGAALAPGAAARVRVDRVTRAHTFGSIVGVGR